MEPIDKAMEMEIDSTSNTETSQTNLIEPPNSSKSLRIDRKTTCPFMIKMYCRINGHHRMEEFSPPRFPVEDEMIVYTWKDATLKELSLLVREVLGDSELPGGSNGNDPNLKFSFNLLFPDVRRPGSHFLSKPLGWVFEGGEGEARLFKTTDSSLKSLETLKFVPGDFIDVAVYTNPAMIPNTYTNTNTNNYQNYEKRKVNYSNNQRRF